MMERDVRAVHYAAILGAFSLVAAPSACAETLNPIFGSASAQPTSETQNKQVVGKGYYADYYGYYGTLYAYDSYYYAATGYNYKDANSYYYGYLYAATAANNLYNAYYYQYYGY